MKKLIYNGFSQQRTPVLCVFFLAVSLSCFAQEGPLSPEWFYYRKSLEAFRADDLGEAMRQLKTLVEAYGENADSLHLRGRIYEQEGELDLAEKYYFDSLAKGDFEVPDEKFTVNYRLANMYYQRKSYKKFEDILEKILSAQPMYTEGRYARLRDSYVSTLLERGFDSLALLYRIPVDFATESHRNLGVFYSRTGRDRAALLHLAFANLAVVSVLSDELKKIDPDYTFSSLEDTLNRAALHTMLADFIVRADFYRSLYFLASALHSLDAAREARKIWEIVAKHGSGEWKNQSRSQLLAPRAEPLITY